MDIAKLRATINGTVIAPGDEGYDLARQTFYGGIDNKPAVIIQAKTDDDVAKAVTLAQSTGLSLGIRSGGHSIAGFSVPDGGIMLDLRNMKALAVDEQNRTAWVESGMTAGEYSKALDAYGLVTGFGDTGSVGIGGITLGGGIGFLVRKYGMAIDNLLAAEVVTAEGKKIIASEQENPDLFWAIRGGGGNFGVATRFQFKLQPLGDAYGGLLILPAEPEVLVRLLETADAAPDELSIIANVMPAMPMPFLPKEIHGQMIIMVLLMYAGPAVEGEKVVASIKPIAPPLADLTKPMRYHEIFMPEDDSYHPTAVSTTMFMDKVDLTLAEGIIERLQKSDAMIRVVQLRTLGGAMAKVPADATAFAHRSHRLLTNVAAFYTTPEDKKIRETWVEDMVALLNQGDDGMYVGFIGDVGEAQVKAAYPAATLKKLKAIKQKYDPANLFKFNHNIKPE
jgi:hypothetical protein